MASVIDRIGAKTFGQILWNLFPIVAGSLLCVAAVNGILITKQFFRARFTGAALIIYYLLPSPGQRG